MPFEASWMDLEIIILSKSEEKDKYHIILLMCGIFKKKVTNKHIHKIEIELQTWRTNLWLLIR